MNDPTSSGALSSHVGKEGNPVQGRGLCGPNPPGGFRELSPHEFEREKEMTVIILKDESARDEFKGFQGVHVLPSSHGIEDFLSRTATARVIGLVCPDGDCSGRLATRISRLGYDINHLSGGLREWRCCSRN